MGSNRLKKKVLIISIGWEQEPLIRKINERQDLELYGINYPGSISYHECFKEIRCIDYRDLKSIFEYVNLLKPDAVISDEDDYGMFLQALIAEKNQLNGPRIENAQIACNKYLQRLKSAEHNIRIPNFRLCKDIDDIKSFIAEFSFPVILKPIDSRGSIGVSKIEKNEEVSECFFKALSASPSLLTIVEEFIEGDHFNVDGYSFGPNQCLSLAVSENKKSKSSKGTINECIIYGDLEKEIQNEMLQIGSSVANALGYSFGFFHGEFMKSHSTGEIYLTEMANRGGGILISEKVLPFHTNFDLLDLYIDDCLGNSISKKISVSNRLCRIDFISLEVGKVYHGFDKEAILRKYDDIIEIVPFIKPGEMLPQIQDGSKRHLMLISKTNDLQKLKMIESDIRLACSK
jgi:predicted ATP-grasp superfamily ATP-dependent carboligase